MKIRIGTLLVLAVCAAAISTIAFAATQTGIAATQTGNAATQTGNAATQTGNAATQTSDGGAQTVDDGQPKRADDTRLYMKAKLACSQKVMEGLVSENFELISDGAKQMKAISVASHWPTTIDEVYQHYSVEFRRQCDKLQEQAGRRDLQAAHYTYLHLATTCIDCHDYVRPRFEVKRTKKGAPVQLIPTQWDSNRIPREQRPGPDDDNDGDQEG